MWNYSDTPSLYNKVMKSSVKEKLSLANDIKNNLLSLNKFIKIILTFQETHGSNEIFLSLLEFGTQHIRIPFLIGLHETKFFEMTKKQFLKWGDVEKQTFQNILENILEIFMDIERSQINSISSENFMYFYQDLFKKELDAFIKKRMKSKSTIIQTEFEKLFNFTKIQIHHITQKLVDQANLKKDDISLFQKKLSEIKINFMEFRTASENSIMKQVLEEKQNLMNFLDYFLSIQYLKCKSNQFLNFNDKKTKIFLHLEQKSTNNLELKNSHSSKLICLGAEEKSTNENGEIVRRKEKNKLNNSSEGFIFIDNDDLDDDIIWMGTSSNGCPVQEKNDLKMHSSSYNHGKSQKEALLKLNKSLELDNKILEKKNKPFETSTNVLTLNSDKNVPSSLENKSLETNLKNDNNDKTFEKSLNKASKCSSDHKVASSLEELISFVYESHLPFLENEELEFKNYSFPFQQGHCNRIKKTVCAFLNTNGGRIYFGVRDEDQCVLGIQLNDNKKIKSFNDSICNTLLLITPEIFRDQYCIKYLPIYDRSVKIPDLYIVKLIIKRGNPNELYFTNERLSYYRRNGKNSKFVPSELKIEILKRASIDENDGKQENFEYNKKFYDFEDLEDGQILSLKILTEKKQKNKNLCEGEFGKKKNYAFVSGKN